MTFYFLNFFKCYLKIAVFGQFTDEFFKACARHNIRLYSLKEKDGVFYCRVSIKDFRKIRVLRRKSKVKIRIESRFGWRFFLHKNRYRKGLALGLCFAVFFLYFASGRIWDVEVIGNNEITTEQVLKTAESYGIKIGAKKNTIDAPLFKQRFLTETPKASFAAFNVNGSVLTIEIAEKTDIPFIEDEKTPCNIIADFDGIVEKVEAYKGFAVLQNGSAVKKATL